MVTAMATDGRGRRLAQHFKTGPIGRIGAGMPRLVRAPLWVAWLQGAFALGVVVGCLGAIWAVGEPGRYVQRVLLSCLLLDYLHAGLTLRVEPEINSPVDVLFDHPLAYYDNANRELTTVFFWLIPARWLAHALAGLVLYRWLPTADQLAENLDAEAADGPTDYTLRVHGSSPARQHPIDEGVAFHQALRRDHGAQSAFALLLCAAGLVSAVAWLPGLSDLWALVVALFVEALAHGFSMLAESPFFAHPDALHIWLSRHRPDIAREGRHMMTNHADSMRVLLHAMLAGALLLWIHVPARECRLCEPSASPLGALSPH